MRRWARVATMGRQLLCGTLFSLVLTPFTACTSDATTTTVDVNALGAVCGLDAGNSCAPDQSCAQYPGFPEPRCGPANPCSIVHCAGRSRCVVQASFPGLVGCP